jgi:hypothetical protein
MGINGLQEVYARGVSERLVEDLQGGSWMLCTAAPQVGPLKHGVGVLVYSSFEVLSFDALSSRVASVTVAVTVEGW